jgi:uncharacterized membrane protein YhaH (DUF805 family)
VSAAIVVLMIFLGVIVGIMQSEGAMIGFAIIAGLITLAVSVCMIGLVVRRFHDVGLSGWLYLLVLVPYLGGIFVFVITLLPSKEPNQYGYGPWRP